MSESDSLKMVYRDTCVKEIRQFYNMEFLKPQNDKHDNKFETYYAIYAKGFINQCNFIFDNYCDYRNSYYHLIQEIIKAHESDDGQCEIQYWFNILDQYYKDQV